MRGTGSMPGMGRFGGHFICRLAIVVRLLSKRLVEISDGYNNSWWSDNNPNCRRLQYSPHRICYENNSAQPANSSPEDALSARRTNIGQLIVDGGRGAALFSIK
jgi:hypothetical protein